MSRFVAVAEQLYIARPVLSRQIRALEDELKLTLFVRNRHAITHRGSVGQSRLRRTGTYSDVCVKVDGTWLFGERVLYKDANSE